MADEIKGKKANMTFKGFYDLSGFILLHDKDNVAIRNGFNGGTAAENMFFRNFTDELITVKAALETGVIAANEEGFKEFAELLTAGTEDTIHRELKKIISNGVMRDVSNYKIGREYLPERGFETLLSCELYSDKASERNIAEWQRAYIDTISTK